MSVPARDLRNAEALVDRWWVDGRPVVDWWARRLRNLDADVDLADVPVRGRPRTLTIRTLLVAWVLVAGTVTGDDKMLVNRAHQKLMNLHPASQRRLGVRWTNRDGTDGKVSLRQVQYLWRRLVGVVDPSEHFAGRGLDPDARRERHDALQAVVDGLLAATMPDDLDHAGSYSVDSTYLPTWAKPYWRADPRRRRPARHTETDDADAGEADGEVALVETDDGRLVDPTTGEIVDDPVFDRDRPDDPGDDEADEELAAAFAGLAEDAGRNSGDAPAAGDTAGGAAAAEQEEEDGAGDEELLEGADQLARALRQAERGEQIRRGEVGSDGTFRGISPAERAAMTHDPDARHRFMARRSPRTGRLNVKTDVFGYQITNAVRVREDDGPAVPALCERLVVHPANHGEAESAVELLGRLTDEGQPLSDVVADRGFTFRRPEVFHLPVRRMGGQLVMDLHPLQRGLRGTYRGMLLVDGIGMSPGTPDVLLEPEAPQPGDSHDEIRRKLEVFEWRQAWAMRRLAGGLEERAACPADGRDAKITCPLKPTSLTLDPTTHQRVYPDDTHRHLPVCQQTSISLPVELDAWRRQKHPFGTFAWWESFRSRRNAVEGIFGNLKTPGTEHLHRGTTRSLGLAANTLLIGLLTAATNIRLLQTFKRDHHARSDDLFRVGEHDTDPRYRTARRSRPAASIAALRQHGAAIRRGDPPDLRRPLALVGGGGAGGQPAGP